MKILHMRLKGIIFISSEDTKNSPQPDPLSFEMKKYLYNVLSQSNVTTIDVIKYRFIAAMDSFVTQYCIN